MIDDGHPFFFLEPLFARDHATFYFSRYIYVPDSVSDERDVLLVPGSSISAEWVEEQMRTLKPEQELAIHSRVLIDGRTYHIPMLDFVTAQISAEQLYRVQTFLPSRVFKSSAFFYSGRSFHAYSSHLLGPKDWYEFLGRALLVNRRDDEEIIDSRWVGHRLIAGYCSLRFSNNSRQYMAMPRKVSLRAFEDNNYVETRVPREQIHSR
jgi:hypothetical protein